MTVARSRSHTYGDYRTNLIRANYVSQANEYLAGASRTRSLHCPRNVVPVSSMSLFLLVACLSPIKIDIFNSIEKLQLPRYPCKASRAHLDDDTY